MTFYGTPATGAGWIVPKKYVEKVGDDGFKKAPVGAGPYKFVSFNPGIELVLEAHDRYWRKTPARQAAGAGRSCPRTYAPGHAQARRGRRRLLAARPARRGGASARRASSSSAPVVNATQWLDFGPHQWDPKSPWHDRRVRLAAALAFDKNAHQPGRDARLLADHRQHHSVGASSSRWRIPPYPYDPAQAQEAPGRGRLSERLRRRRLRVPTRPTRAWPRRSATISARSASAPSCGRWSARRSSATGRTRRSRWIM